MWLEPPPIEQGYFPFNPSMVIHRGILLVNYRCANYFYQGDHLKRTTICRAHGPGPNYYNHYILAAYDVEALAGDEMIPLRWWRRVVDPQGATIYGKSSQKGLQDMRLFIHRGELRFLANMVSMDPTYAVGLYLGSLGLLEAAVAEPRENGGELRVVFIKPVESPYGWETEKNWLPLPRGYSLGREEGMWFAYRVGRLWIRLDEDGSVREFILRGDNRDLSGSAGFVPWRKGLLALCHTVRMEKGGRTYLHRLMHLEVADGEIGEILDLSRIFIFDRVGVEYCLSMVPLGDGVLFAVGINDNEVRFYHLTDSELGALFTGDKV